MSFKVPSLVVGGRRRGEADGVDVHGFLPDAAAASAGHGAGEERGGVECVGGEEGGFPALPYSPPSWGGPPAQPFNMTVIKNGTVVKSLSLGQSSTVFGRLPCCHVVLEHPSVSRYHAVLQCRPCSSSGGGPSGGGDGPEAELHVFDLGSTHGTFLNKRRLEPHCFHRLREGQMLHFGGSSRLFLLESWSDQEGVEAAARDEIAALLTASREAGLPLQSSQAGGQLVGKKREEEDGGVTWGIVMDDSVTDAVLADEPETLEKEREAYYRDDPKRALRKYFEREGLEMEYETTEEGDRHSRIFTVRLRLPMEAISGEPVYAEGRVQGKKREAVLACALDACRILDSHDVLRAPRAGQQRYQRDWADNDYYDSDEDTFLDRTGQIEEKRQQRMRGSAAHCKDTASSYQSLVERLKIVHSEIVKLEEQLRHAKKASSESEAGDSLEAFMDSLKDQLEGGRHTDLHVHMHKLRREATQLERLVELAKPAQLPVLEEGGTKPPATPLLPITVPPATTTPPPPKTIPPAPTTTHPPPSNAITLLTSVPFPPTITPSPPTITPSPPTITPSPSTITPSSHAHVKESLGKRLSQTHPQAVKMPRPQELGGAEASVDPDPDYSTWLPPNDQSGDGRTHLNQRYGY